MEIATEDEIERFEVISKLSQFIVITTNGKLLKYNFFKKTCFSEYSGKLLFKIKINRIA